MTALSTCFLFGVFFDGELNWSLFWIVCGLPPVLMYVILSSFMREKGRSEGKTKLTSQLCEGVKLFYGSLGTGKNPAEAAGLVRDALSNGVEKLVEEKKDKKGMTALGLIYLEGIGVNRDSERAKLWFRAAISDETNNG